MWEAIKTVLRLQIYSWQKREKRKYTIVVSFMDERESNVDRRLKKVQGMYPLLPSRVQHWHKLPKGNWSCIIWYFYERWDRCLPRNISGRQRVTHWLYSESPPIQQGVDLLCSFWQLQQSQQPLLICETNIFGSGNLCTHGPTGINILINWILKIRFIF